MGEGQTSPVYLMNKLTISNLALSKVGSEGGLISDFDDDNSKEGVLCRQFYDQALHEMLRRHVWNCAKKRTELTVEAEAPAFGYNKRFELPSDCLRPLKFVSAQKERDQETEWVVEGNYILTNAETGYLVYVANEPLRDDPLFIKAFVQNLAIMLVYPMTQDARIQKGLIEELEFSIMPEARRCNAFEGYKHPRIHSDWLDATHGGGIYRPFADADHGTITVE